MNDSQAFPENDSASSTIGSRSTASIKAMTSTAFYIKEQAYICASERRDENAWSMDDVRPLMDFETSGPPHEPAKPTFTRVEYM